MCGTRLSRPLVSRPLIVQACPITTSISGRTTLGQSVQQVKVVVHNLKGLSHQTIRPKRFVSAATGDGPAGDAMGAHRVERWRFRTTGGAEVEHFRTSSTSILFSPVGSKRSAKHTHTLRYIINTDHASAQYLVGMYTNIHATGDYYARSHWQNDQHYRGRLEEDICSQGPRELIAGHVVQIFSQGSIVD